MSNAQPRTTTDRCIECDGELLLFAESPCGWCQQCGTIATSVKTGTGYQAKYFIPKQVATLTAEVARLRGVEALHYLIMDSLRRSKMKHGDCRSGERYDGRPLACTACMAQMELDKQLAKYKGRPVQLAAALADTEPEEGGE